MLHLIKGFIKDDISINKNYEYNYRGGLMDYDSYPVFARSFEERKRRTYEEWQEYVKGAVEFIGNIAKIDVVNKVLNDGIILNEQLWFMNWDSKIRIYAPNAERRRSHWARGQAGIILLSPAAERG